MPRNPGADVLRYFAGRLDVDAHARRRAGDDTGADQAAALADEMRAEAARLEATPLTEESQRSTVGDVMTEEHRAALSDSRWAGNNPVMNAAKAHGIVSLHALAKKLGEDPGFLSKVIRGKRPMPERLARAIEKAIGYPASAWKR